VKKWKTLQTDFVAGGCDHMVYLQLPIASTILMEFEANAVFAWDHLLNAGLIVHRNATDEFALGEPCRRWAEMTLDGWQAKSLRHRVKDERSTDVERGLRIFSTRVRDSGGGSQNSMALRRVTTSTAVPASSMSPARSTAEEPAPMMATRQPFARRIPILSFHVMTLWSGSSITCTKRTWSCER